MAGFLQLLIASELEGCLELRGYLENHLHYLCSLILMFIFPLPLPSGISARKYSKSITRASCKERGQTIVVYGIETQKGDISRFI